jgi:hypothetical protein
MSFSMKGALGTSWWQEHREKSADNTPQSKNQIILGKRMRRDCATFLRRKVIKGTLESMRLLRALLE